MRKLISTFVLLVALLPVAVSAQVIRYAYTSEQLTVSNTAVGFTAAKLRQSPIQQANKVTFTVNCASGTTCVLRFTIDGTTPTASLGLRALYGDTVTIEGFKNNLTFLGIRETSTDVKLDVTFSQ